MEIPRACTNLSENRRVPSELATLASAAAEDQGETKIFTYLFI